MSVQWGLKTAQYDVVFLSRSLLRYLSTVLADRSFPIFYRMFLDERNSTLTVKTKAQRLDGCASISAKGGDASTRSVEVIPQRFRRREKLLGASADFLRHGGSCPKQQTAGRRLASYPPRVHRLIIAFFWQSSSFYQLERRREKSGGSTEEALPNRDDHWRSGAGSPPPKVAYPLQGGKRLCKYPTIDFAPQGARHPASADPTHQILIRLRRTGVAHVARLLDCQAEKMPIVQLEKVEVEDRRAFLLYNCFPVQSRSLYLSLLSITQEKLATNWDNKVIYP
uniref:Uncharacterized protein n=1 Tax=Trichuris muris TaxID=70415 RepID=A0A5S6R054_TRIMR